MATLTTTAERPMPHILDYASAADWQAAWRAWDQERAAATGRQARTRAARSNAAKRGAATRKRHSTRCRMACDSRDYGVTHSGGQTSCT